MTFLFIVSMALMLACFILGDGEPRSAATCSIAAGICALVDAYLTWGELWGAQFMFSWGIVAIGIGALRLYLKGV